MHLLRFSSRILKVFYVLLKGVVFLEVVFFQTTVRDFIPVVYQCEQLFKKCECAVRCISSSETQGQILGAISIEAEFFSELFFSVWFTYCNIYFFGCQKTGAFQSGSRGRDHSPRANGANYGFKWSVCL